MTLRTKSQLCLCSLCRSLRCFSDELVDTWLKYTAIDHKHMAARHCWFFFSIIFKAMLLNAKATAGLGTNFLSSETYLLE